MLDETGGGYILDMDRPFTTAQTKTLPMKRTVLQIAGQCKKMKAHKEVPQFTLTEDDIELVAEKVQDHMVESWYDAEK
jgi:NACalpha-BTF3-like transcription factor